MPVHQVAIHNALIALFETPVPDDNAIGRTVFTRVLGPDPLDFGKLVFDFKDKEHLSALSKQGVSPVVWEAKFKPSTRTVLNPIETEGHELLLDFLGGPSFQTFHHLNFIGFLLACTHLLFILHRTCALWMAKSLL
jgi:hypothetical protein